jgi:hypothetical protein
MRKVVISLFHRLVGRYGQLVLRCRSVLVICTQLGLIAAANAAFALRFEGHSPDYARLFYRPPLVLVIYAVGRGAFGIHADSGVMSASMI